MAYFRVDDDLWAHPKWVSLSLRAKALWITAASWSSRYASFGHIPTAALKSFVGIPNPKRAAQELVDAELWEVADDGYQFHDWNDYNLSRESWEEKKEANRARKQKERANTADDATRNDTGNEGVEEATSEVTNEGTGEGAQDEHTTAKPENFQKTDEKLSKNFQKTDEKLSKNFQKTDEKVKILEEENRDNKPKARICHAVTSVPEPEPDIDITNVISLPPYPPQPEPAPAEPLAVLAENVSTTENQTNPDPEPATASTTALTTASTTALTTTSTNSHPTQPATSSSYPEKFEQFWNAYRHHGNKKQAHKAWRTATKHGTNPDLLTHQAAQYHQHADTTGTEPRYRKHAATWLNNDCWNDDYTTPPPPATTTRLTRSEQAILADAQRIFHTPPTSLITAER